MGDLLVSLLGALCENDSGERSTAKCPREGDRAGLKEPSASLRFILEQENDLTAVSAEQKPEANEKMLASGLFTAGSAVVAR